jgi:hypothetical protein
LPRNGSPARNLSSDQSAKDVRPSALDDQTLFIEIRLNFGVVDHAINFGVKTRDDRWRRPGRHEDANPCDCFEPRIAYFIEGWHIREVRIAL